MSETGKHATIHWTLAEDGTLTITGSGKIPDSSCGNKPPAPWAEKHDEIKKLVIEEGITEIGVNAFRDCRNLSEAAFPEGLTRIGAYAFQGCTNLRQITSAVDSFRYILEPMMAKKIRPSFRNRQETPESILFGVDSFRSVPWALERWGDFYSRHGILYSCFSDARRLTVPIGIHTLKALSLAKKNLTQLTLPISLRVIEATAFAESSFRNALKLPEEIETVDPDAFVGCKLKRIIFPSTWPIRKTPLNQYSGKLSRRRTTTSPKWINRYSLSSEPVWEDAPFRRLKITENKEVHHKDGTITKVRDDNWISVGDRILRRLRFGVGVIGVIWSGEQFKFVKTLSWDKYSDYPEFHTLYPDRDKKSLFIPWEDIFNITDEDDLCSYFGVDGEQMMKTATLHDLPTDPQEEWFVCLNTYNLGGPTEQQLIEHWLADHPEIHF